MIEHDTFFSHFEQNSPDVLIVAFSGSGIISINKSAYEPIIWAASFLRRDNYSFLSFTAKELHFWPDDCVEAVLELYRREIQSFSKVLVIGYSMGGWGAIAHAHKFGAQQVLAISPRTPANSNLYDTEKFGEIASLAPPQTLDVFTITDGTNKREIADAENLEDMLPFTCLRLDGVGHDSYGFLLKNRLMSPVLRKFIAGSLSEKKFSNLLKYKIFYQGIAKIRRHM